MTEHSAKNLEVQVVDHCNLDCVACSHESPLLPRRAEDPGRLHDSLQALWRHYRAPMVKLLGGEPLLHRELEGIIEVVRRVTGARVRLVTNGTLLRQRANALSGLDEIHVSTYPNIVLPDLDELKAIAAAVHVSITIQRFDAFRWHRSPKLHTRELTRRVFATCQLYQDWECHTVRDGRFYACSPSGTWGDPADGVDLLSPEDVVARGLQRVLGRTTPLSTCQECLGSVGALVEHRQGWRREPDPLADAALDEDFLATLEGDPDAWNGCYAYEFTIWPSGDVIVR